MILGPAGGTPSQLSAALMIGIYFLVAGGIALVYFRTADIARRVS
jgi:hypothetical protein